MCIRDRCSGCTVSGVCGKKPDVAAMQDLLVYVTKGLSAVTTELRFDGKEIEAYVNEMIIVNPVSYTHLIYSSYNPATRNPIATARYANRIRYAM